MLLMCHKDVLYESILSIIDKKINNDTVAMAKSSAIGTVADGAHVHAGQALCGSTHFFRRRTRESKGNDIGPV